MTPRTSTLYKETLRLGPLSNQELSEHLSLSPAGITQMVKPLEARGILLSYAPQEFDPERLVPQETSFQRNRSEVWKTKRRKTTFGPNPEFGFLVACQFNQREINIQKLSFNLNIEEEYSYPIHQETDRSLPQILLDIIPGHIKGLKSTDSRPCLGLGLAVAGRIEQETNKILYSQNVPSIAGVDLATPLEKELEIPVVLVNDAHAICLGEWLLGEARQMDHFLTLFIDQGVGLGIMINGAPYQGFDQLAGEPGQLILEPGGKQKSGFVDGSFEAYVSQTAVWEQLSQAYEQAEPYEAYNLLLELYRKDPKQAAPILDSLAHSLGLLCTNLFLLLSPQLISLTGPLSQFQDVLLIKIQESVTLFAPETVKESLPHRLAMGQNWNQKMAQGAALVAAQRYLDNIDARML